MVFGLFETPRSFEEWYRKFSGRGLFKTLNPARQVAWLAKNHPEWFFDFIYVGQPLQGSKDVRTVLSDIMAYASVFASNLSDLSSAARISRYAPHPARDDWNARCRAIFDLAISLSTYDRAYAFAKGLGSNAPLFVSSIWAPTGETVFTRGMGKDGCRGFIDALSIPDVMRLNGFLVEFLKWFDERYIERFAARFDESTCALLINPPEFPSKGRTFHSWLLRDLGFRLEAFGRGLSPAVVLKLFSSIDAGFGKFLAGLGEGVELFAKGLSKNAGTAGNGLSFANLENFMRFFEGKSAGWNTEGWSIDLVSFFKGLGSKRITFAQFCLMGVVKYRETIWRVIDKFESAPGFLDGLDDAGLREWEYVKRDFDESAIPAPKVEAVASRNPPVTISPSSSASKCLYCSDDLLDTDAVLECDSCHVVLHNACAESHGNVCPTPGCQGRLYALVSKRPERSRQSMK